jgi:hypothetical protein
MERYVGQPLTQPVLDYGPPTAAFDIDKNTRAFIWSMEHSHTSPGYASTTGTVDSNGFFSAHTSIHPAETTNWKCSYVLYAQRNGSDVPGPAAWTVTSFKKPNIMCE